MSEIKTTPARDWAADRVICENATAGPWLQVEYGDRSIVGTSSVIVEPVGDDMTYLDVNEADSRFIAEARTGWPAALDEIERLHRSVGHHRRMAEISDHFYEKQKVEIQRYRQAFEQIIRLELHNFTSESRAFEGIKNIAKEALSYDGN